VLLVQLCFVLVFYVGQLSLLSLLSFFILISIGCSGALLLSLVFEMEIKYMVMMILTMFCST